jgi:hypothetical protein
MKETVTCCSISWKKKLLLFSIIAVLLIFAVMLSNQVENEVVSEPEIMEEVLPFSNGPSSPPEAMRMPDSPPPSTN